MADKLGRLLLRFRGLVLLESIIVSVVATLLGGSSALDGIGRNTDPSASTSSSNTASSPPSKRSNSSTLT